MLRRLVLLVYLAFSLLTVCVASAQDAAPDYFAEVWVDNFAPYVGQQITYQFRFFDATGVSNPLYEAPDFEGFWRIDKNGVSRTAQQLNNRQYAVAELQTALYPTRPGTITIAPAVITLPETVFRAEERFTTQSLTFDVKPLPDGAPDDFTGAVGQFQLSATLDRQSVPLGETFTLRLTVTGTGNVEQLALPDFPEQMDWRIYANPTSFTTSEVNGLVVGEKVYEYLFVPNQTGQLDLPIMTLHYFDPNAVTYRSINTAPISVEVLSPPQSGTSAVAQITPVPDANDPLPLKPVSLLLQPAPIIPGMLFWLLWLIPPAAACASLVWVWYQSRKRARLSKNRSSLAFQRARMQLESLTKGSTNSRKPYEKVQRVILTYLGDRLDKDTRDWTSAEVEMVFNQVDVPGELKQRVLLCLAWVDEGLYAPAPSIDVSALSRRTAETLLVLEQNWKQLS